MIYFTMALRFSTFVKLKYLYVSELISIIPHSCVCFLFFLVCVVSLSGCVPVYGQYGKFNVYFSFCVFLFS